MINENIVSSQGSSLNSSAELEELINRVRPGIKPEIIIRGVLAKVQKDIEDKLQEKTGWGRIELSREIAQILSNTDKWAVANFK